MSLRKISKVTLTTAPHDVMVKLRYVVLYHSLRSPGQEWLPSHHTELSEREERTTRLSLLAAAMTTGDAVSLDLVFHRNDEANLGRAQPHRAKHHTLSSPHV